MDVPVRAVKHAGGLYGKTFSTALKPFRNAEAEIQHLHEIEQAGDSGETPFIAILGLVIFLGSCFVVLLAIALAAYYLAG